MEFLIGAVLLGLIPGVIAQNKGRSFLEWWLFGALLFIVALPMAVLLKPLRDQENDLASVSVDTRIKPLTVLLLVALFVAGGWFFYSGAYEANLLSGSRHFIQKIENDVASDAVRQYNIAARNGTAIDRCVQAGMVSAAYLQAENEHEYAKWKQIEMRECKAAGMPGNLYKPVTRPTNSKPAPSADPKKPHRWQDSKGYWHFSDEDPALEKAHTVSGTGIYKWQDDQGNWHYSDKGIQD